MWNFYKQILHPSNLLASDWFINKVIKWACYSVHRRKKIFIHAHVLNRETLPLKILISLHIQPKTMCYTWEYSRVYFVGVKLSSLERYVPGSVLTYGNSRKCAVAQASCISSRFLLFQLWRACSTFGSSQESRAIVEVQSLITWRAANPRRWRFQSVHITDGIPWRRSSWDALKVNCL